MKHLFATTVFLLFITPLYAQYVGVGTATPQALLHVNNGSFIFTSSGSTGIRLVGRPPHNVVCG